MGKTITTSDFPMEVSDKIKHIFAMDVKAKAAARVMMNALFETIAKLDCIEPWLQTKKAIPELAEFMVQNPGIRLIYNHLEETFTIKPTED